MTGREGRETIERAQKGPEPMPINVLLVSALAVVWAAAAWAGPKPAKPDTKSETKVEKECPHAYGAFDKITADMDKAPSCREAMELASACAMGGSSDVQLGAAVQERCERDFLARLNKAQRRAYEADHKRCERKYRRTEGTMYRSAEAFCHAEVAEKFVRRFAKKPPRN
jgi:hypothetical protein